LSDAAPNEPKRDRWTVLEVLRWTTGRFDERGLPTPRLDAEVLIADALRLPRVQLYVQFDRPLTADELTAIRAHVRRRQAGESVAYVVGHKEFFGLELAVDRRVLVPRPDSETLVDEALARWREHVAAAAAADVASADPHAEAEAEASPRIADIGTGSGAIIVAIGKQLPSAALFAVDKSAEALEVARANADRHAVAVTWLEGDLGAPLAPHAPFDLIVANLPYVTSADLAGLAPEVRAEPVIALDGGPDGLALVRRLVATALPLLQPGGALVLEIGAGQAAHTAALCEVAGFGNVRLRRDLGQVDRVVSSVRPW
jgi:release factor glutamine methyltransferase